MAGHGKIHTIGSSEDHSASTLAEINALVSDEVIASEIYVDNITTSLSGNTTELSGTVDTHIASDGTDHTYIDQDVRTTAKPSLSGLTLTDNLILPKTSGYGIQVDTSDPLSATFGWRDIVGYPTLRGNASVDPVWATYRGNISQYSMTTNAKYLTFCFHVPHDYLPGSDLYVHVHWSHIRPAVTTGSVTWEFETTYAKGHDQGPFVAPVTTTVPQAASTTQYQHMIAETPISIVGGSGNLLNTTNIEVDGLIIVRIRWSANTMDDSGIPFFHTADLHYQSTNMATKQKAPPFWT